MTVRPLRFIIARYAVVSAGFPFLIMLLLGFFWLIPLADRELDNNQRQLAVAVANQVESYLRNARSSTASIASFCEDQGTTHDLKMIQRMLVTNVRILKRLKSCYLVDKSGRIAAISIAGRPALQQELLGVDLSRNPLFATTIGQGEEQWSDSYLSIVGGGISVASAIPLRDRVLIGELDLGRLSKYLDRINSAENERIFVLDRRGQVVADRGGKYTAQQLNLSNYPIVSRGLRENRSMAGDIVFEGRKMAGSLYRIPELNWSVLVAQPRAEANSQLLTSASIAGLGLMAALLLSGVLVFPFTRTLIRRLEQLADHASSVAAGNAHLAWPSSRIAEFNNLAGSLQRMSGSLQERAESLADEVRVREMVEETLRERNEDLAAAEEELRQQVDELFSAQEGLKQSEEAYRTVADWTYDWEYWLSPEKKFIYTSPSCERITGYRSQEFLADPDLIVRITHPDDREAMREHFDACATHGGHGLMDLETLEFKLEARDGTILWIEHSCRPVFNAQGHYLGRRACNRDITERRLLEMQIHQQQKLEGIGLLAGGIAHDFNNLLLPILVCAEMIGMDSAEDGQVQKRADMILEAGHKAKNLVKQLLTFSHKQELQSQNYDLNEIVGSFSGMLRRTIRENIELKEHLSSTPCRIMADRIQIEQILLNLAVNAMDAITDNGGITVETGHLVFEGEFCRLHPGIMPGKYVMMAFSDTGSGMDDATLAHIYEPFFTTKPVGRGTGLGLSTIYGIVKQHGGTIDVYSTQGKGTTFKIYFPETESTEEAETATTLPRDSKTVQNGVILLVEDNAMVLTTVRAILEKQGYLVLAAALPEEAMELARTAGSSIDLLVSDVVMPQMSGPDLYECLVEMLPGLRGIFMSGYANSAVVHKGQLREGVNFIAKPFTSEALLDKVIELLGLGRDELADQAST